MQISKLPVVAVIPNYNMASYLEKLLPQLIAQGYDEIFVLDDVSTDNSLEFAKQFGDKVKVVTGQNNVGSGANRNRILQALKYEAIIHFVDADVDLETTDVVRKARHLMNRPNVGFVGGLVKDKTGRQMIWNYGPRFSLYAELTATLQYLFAHIPVTKRRLRKITRWLTSDWPDVMTKSQAQPVFWLVEANMFIKRSTFEKLGGFDETVREHDIFQPALRAHQLGLVSYFDPIISVTHLQADVRGYNREIAQRRTAFYLLRKQGFKNWLLPDGRFKPRYNT